MSHLTQTGLGWIVKFCDYRCLALHRRLIFAFPLSFVFLDFSFYFVLLDSFIMYVFSKRYSDFEVGMKVQNRKHNSPLIHFALMCIVKFSDKEDF